MEWLEANAPDLTVLDYGCGSGSGHGCCQARRRPLVGVDVDPQAIQSANFNAEKINAY